MENIFKAFRRLARRGSENGCLSIDRVYNIGSSAAQAAFPNVYQDQVSVDEMESLYGRGNWNKARECLQLGRTGKALARSTYRSADSAWIRKPKVSDRTMAPSAHSQQIAFEECLLSAELGRDGSFVDTRALTHSWYCKLIHTVGAEAKNCEEPVVLVHRASGSAFLIVLSLARCLMAWPLSVVSVADAVLGLCPLKELMPLIITNPCLSVSLVKMYQVCLLGSTSTSSFKFCWLTVTLY